MPTTEQTKTYLASPIMYFGPNLPTSSLEDGRLFYLTTTEGFNSPGLYIFKSGAWTVTHDLSPYATLSYLNTGFYNKAYTDLTFATKAEHEADFIRASTLTLTVGPGKQYAHPQDAVDYLANRIKNTARTSPNMRLVAVIQIDPGTYIPKSGSTHVVQIRDMEADITIRGNTSNPYSVVFDLDGGTSLPSNIGVKAYNSVEVRVEGIHFTGSYVPPTSNNQPYTRYEFGIIAEAGSLVWVTNCHFSNLWRGVYAAYASLITFNGSFTYMFRNVMTDLGSEYSSSIICQGNIDSAATAVTSTDPCFRITVGGTSIGTHFANASRNSFIYVGGTTTARHKYNAIWAAHQSHIQCNGAILNQNYVGISLSYGCGFISPSATFTCNPTGMGGGGPSQHPYAIYAAMGCHISIDSGQFIGNGVTLAPPTWIDWMSVAKTSGLTMSGFPVAPVPAYFVYDTAANSYQG